MLSYLVERGAARLRAQDLKARALEVRVRWVDTNPRRGAWNEEGLSVHRRRALARPSDATAELTALALELYHSFPRRRALLKRIGVSFHGLAAAPGWQGRLFSDEEPALERSHDASHADRHRRLDRALDELRKKHGFGRILRGTSTPLAESHPLDEDGFRLRTPSLNQ